MRRTLKFFHTMGALGLVGAVASLIVLLSHQSGASPPTEQTLAFVMEARILSWIFLPSLAVTLVAGLLAIAINPGFHDAGWAWTKAATGILVFEGGLNALGPIQNEAKRGAASLANHLEPISVKGLIASEITTLWLLLFISAVNVALGVWRPRLPRIPI